MEPVSEDFLSETREFWQQYTKENLTLEDAREIAENLTGFCKILLKWQAAEHKKGNMVE